jgi:hypothetical protein
MGAGKMAIIMKINGFGGVYGLNEDYELMFSVVVPVHVFHEDPF